MRTLLFSLFATALALVSNQTGDNLGGCGLRCRKLTFVGEASVPVKPTWGLVVLSVEVNSLQLQGGNTSTTSTTSGNSSETSPEMQAALKVREEAQRRAAFILNYLKDLDKDLREVQMQELSFLPAFDVEEGGEPKFLGYLATFSLSFKVKLDKLQDVLDHVVTEQGANRIDSIGFLADEDDEKQANLKAIELATSNAWEQAQALAKVFGIQGDLKLLSVRDRILSGKRLVRGMARRRLRRLRRRLRDDDDDDSSSMMTMGKGMRMRGMMRRMRNRMGWNNDISGMMGNWGQGDQIIDKFLVFQFDFQDGSINFQKVEPIKSNFTVADSFGPLLGNQTTTSTKPGETSKPEAIEKPANATTTTANNTTTANTTASANNTTAAITPTETAQPATTTPPQ